MEATTSLPDGLGGELVIAAADYVRNRPRWLEARRSGLGASDTAGILGLVDYANSTPLAIWREKRSTLPPDDSELSEAAEWGNVLEAPVARRTVARHPDLGKILPTPGLLRHPEFPWMLATVDRLLVPRRVKAPRVESILEVKTTSDRNYRARWIEGVPPVSIQVQVQQQLAVTGLEYAWVTCLIGGQKLADPVRIERSEEVIAQLVNYAGTWWADHVVAGVRPEPTFKDSGILHELWPAELAADAVTAGADLEQVVAELIDAKRRKAEAEEDEERAAFTLKTAMKERTAVVNSAGEGLVTWKEQTTRRLDSKALTAAHPDIAAQFKPAKTSRVLRVVNKKEK